MLHKGTTTSTELPLGTVHLKGQGLYVSDTVSAPCTTGLIGTSTGLIRISTGLIRISTELIRISTGLIRISTGLISISTGLIETHTGFTRTHNAPTSSSLIFSPLSSDMYFLHTIEEGEETEEPLQEPPGGGQKEADRPLPHG